MTGGGGLVDVGGRRLAVDDVAVPGWQTRPAVLMLHGLGGTTSVFEHQAQALAGTHRIVRLDFCGAGRSPVGDGITLDRHAQDALAVLDMLDVNRVVVVAHSIATVVARTLAARHPQRVAGMVLLAPTRAPAPDAVQQRQHQRAARLRAGGTAAIIDEVLRDSVGATTLSSHPVRAAFIRELALRQDPEGYARNYEAAAAAVDPGPLPEDIAVVLIGGHEDQLGSEAAAAALAETSSAARVMVAPGSGHTIPIEAPEFKTAAVRELLTAVDSSVS